MTRRSDSYLKIGLTGGIGSGKSTAARRFGELGARVYHADEISRLALNPGAICYDRVVDAFGKDILKPDGTIDRKLLGAIVFGSDEKRELLNDIIHPYVIDELLSRAERDFLTSNYRIAVFEVPLLFESGMDAWMNFCVVVTCDKETRIQRVMERDGLLREQVEARMRAQMSEEEKRLLADFLLDNNSAEDEFKAQVDALYQKLTAEEQHS